MRFEKQRDGWAAARASRVAGASGGSGVSLSSSIFTPLALAATCEAVGQNTPQCSSIRRCASRHRIKEHHWARGPYRRRDRRHGVVRKMDACPGLASKNACAARKRSTDSCTACCVEALLHTPQSWSTAHARLPAAPPPSSAPAGRAPAAAGPDMTPAVVNHNQ